MWLKCSKARKEDLALPGRGNRNRSRASQHQQQVFVANSSVPFPVLLFRVRGTCSRSRPHRCTPTLGGVRACMCVCVWGRKTLPLDVAMAMHVHHSMHSMRPPLLLLLLFGVLSCFFVLFCLGRLLLVMWFGGGLVPCPSEAPGALCCLLRYRNIKKKNKPIQFSLNFPRSHCCMTN